MAVILPSFLQRRKTSALTFETVDYWNDGSRISLPSLRSTGKPIRLTLSNDQKKVTKNRKKKGIIEEPRTEIIFVEKSQEGEESVTPSENLFPLREELPTPTPVIVPRTTSLQIQIAHEALRETKLLMLTDIQLAAKIVQDYVKQSFHLSSAIGRNTDRFRNFLLKINSDDLNGTPGMFIWTAVAAKLSFLSSWREDDMVQIQIHWNHLCFAEMQLRSTLGALEKEVDKFRADLHAHFGKSLLKNKDIKKEFIELIKIEMSREEYLQTPKGYANTRRLEVEEKSNDPPKDEIRISCTNEDAYIVCAELEGDPESPPAQVIKFSLLETKIQKKFLCEVLANMTFILTQVITHVGVGGYDKLIGKQENVSLLSKFKTKKLRSLEPLDRLVLAHGLKSIVVALAQEVIHLRSLQRVIVSFHNLLSSVRIALMTRGYPFLKPRRKFKRYESESKLEATLAEDVLALEIKNYELKENRLFRNMCQDLMCKFGKTLKEMMHVSWLNHEEGTNIVEEAEKMIVEPTNEKEAPPLSSDENQRRDDMMETLTDFLNDFLNTVVGGTLRALRRLQVPIASVEAGHVTLVPAPPVGHVEGLCHLIAVASSKIKVTQIGKEGEELRKRFFSLTNALLTLSHLRQSVEDGLIKNIKSTLDDMQMNSDYQLQDIYENKIPDLNIDLPICQVPNANVLQWAWTEDTEEQDDRNFIGIQWDSETQNLLCFLEPSSLDFSKLSSRSQLKFLKGVLDHTNHLVQQAAFNFQDSKRNSLRAKDILKVIGAYFLQLEEDNEIRAEEKDVVLLVLRTQFHTTFHQLDQLERTLKRTRFSLSHAIRTIREKSISSELTDGAKENPFGYSRIYVRIPQILQVEQADDQSGTQEQTNDTLNSKDADGTKNFIRKFSEATEDAVELLYAPLSAIEDLLLERSEENLQSTAIGQLLLLGETLIGVGNFRDVPEPYRNLISTGLTQLEKKLAEFEDGRSIQRKLRQALQKGEKVIDWISNELRVSMNTYTHVMPQAEEKVLRMHENLKSDSAEMKEWMLTMTTLSSGDTPPILLLVVARTDEEIKYSELSRLEQARVVFETINALYQFFEDVLSLLKNSVLTEIGNSTQRLKTLKCELKNFQKTNGFAPDLDVTPELQKLGHILYLAKAKTWETLGRIFEAGREAKFICDCVTQYGNLRLKVEPLQLTPGRREGSKRRTHRHGHTLYKTEQEKQILEKMKKELGQRETFIRNSVKDTKHVQIPLNLKTEQRN